jgi:hypothetical protein
VDGKEKGVLYHFCSAPVQNRGFFGLFEFSESFVKLGLSFGQSFKGFTCFGAKGGI